MMSYLSGLNNITRYRLMEIIAICLTIAIVIQRSYMKISHILIAGAILLSGYYLYKYGDFRLYEKVKKIIVPLGVFFACLIISVLFSPEKLLSFHTLLKYAVYWPLHALIVVAVIDDWKIVRNCLVLLLLTAAVENVYGFYYWVTTLVSRWGGFYRGDLLIYGMCSVMYFCITTIIALETSNIRYRIFAAICSCAYVLGMISCGSRGAWLTAVIVFSFTGVYFFIRSPKKLIIILSILISFSLPFLVNPSLRLRLFSITNVTTDMSNVGRLIVWHRAWEMAKDKPITGIGLGRWKKEHIHRYGVKNILDGMLEEHAHNNYLQFLAEAGVLGCFGFVAVMISLFLYFLKMLCKKPNLFALMGIAVVLTMNIDGIIEATYKFQYSARTFWFLVGCLMALMESYDKKRSNGS